MHAGVIVLCMTNAAPERVCTLTSQCDPHRSPISTESVTFDDSQYHLTHRGCASAWASLDLASLRLLIPSLACTMVMARLVVLLRSHGCREAELFQYDCARSATPSSKSELWKVAKDNPAIRRSLSPLDNSTAFSFNLAEMLTVSDHCWWSSMLLMRTATCQIANRSCRRYLNR